MIIIVSQNCSRNLRRVNTFYWFSRAFHFIHNRLNTRNLIWPRKITIQCFFIGFRKPRNFHPYVLYELISTLLWLINLFWDFLVTSHFRVVIFLNPEISGLGPGKKSIGSYSRSEIDFPTQKIRKSFRSRSFRCIYAWYTMRGMYLYDPLMWHIETLTFGCSKINLNSKSEVNIFSNDSYTTASLTSQFKFQVNKR